MVGDHAALCPHRQAPLARGARLRPQQEGPKHVSPQQSEGTGSGRAGGAEGRPPILDPASGCPPGITETQCLTQGRPLRKAHFQTSFPKVSKGSLIADNFKTQSGEYFKELLPVTGQVLRASLG